MTSPTRSLADSHTRCGVRLVRFQLHPESRGTLCALAPAAAADWLIPQSSRTTGALRQTRRCSAFKTFKSRLRRGSINVTRAVKHREAESWVQQRCALTSPRGSLDPSLLHPPGGGTRRGFSKRSCWIFRVCACCRPVTSRRPACTCLGLPQGSCRFCRRSRAKEAWRLQQLCISFAAVFKPESLFCAVT